MERAILNVEVREKVGKSVAKKLRKEARIPAVVYRKGKIGTNIFVAKKDILKVLHTKAGENVLIDLHVKDEAKGGNKTVIIKEIQHDPLKGEMLHIDFQQISLTEHIKVNVPIVIKGTAAGIKEGGVLEYVIRELEVECLPTNIPEKVEVDVSAMNIGDIIYIKDIKVAADVKILNDLELVALLLKAPQEEKVEEAVPAEEAAAEPEVLKQKKPEEIAAEEAEKEKEKEKKEKKEKE